ncbi:PD-(D/E)XK nuclease family protein [Dyadobacter sandarakinus]|uniref:PD-(D/E)XK nuclease family protein n=1 Tax=Dyadobacter sandarakinus TaxID=2747268 RepID=A0ABX7I0V7_9BACT|nr:PD-(D/E)XK nuclease family protein [Dyadobacter sandarakinus]QRQ99685.1 PD-(D/E)XK nuclease family protein [Dyadobacter sandarakinus]
MAQTFLNAAARHILGQHSSLENVHIVVPTRRAAFFLMRELAVETALPLMSPTVVAVDDFVESLCALQVEDPVHLLFDLYETFREIDPAISFERFMGWASVLLADLDRVDQYLVDTDYLFSYLSEAQAISRWQSNLPEGRELSMGGGTSQYFSLFENIKTLYTSFRTRLAQKGKAYRGMAYREVAEHGAEDLTASAGFEKIYFAGFNAFTQSEKVIIQRLRKAGKAEVLWDTDRYYMSANKNMEAGRTLREYQQSGTFGPWNWTTDDLLRSSKTITVYGVPNATLQTKVAGQLYRQMRKLDSADEPTPTAIVLADENLLLPMLYSLDEQVEDLNVTMGLSMRNSLLYTLVDGIFELQQNMVEFRVKSGKTVRVPKFSHKTIDKILNHPFIRHYEHSALHPLADGQTIVRRTLREITNGNKVFLSSADLLDLGEQHPLFKVLFTHWPKNDPKAIIASFYQLIELLREVYKDYKNALETEYLYLFYTLLKQFEQTIEEKSGLVTLRTLKSFMFELIRQTKIPFSGEPVSDLQIMGMLETRALDFRRLIILSMNEGMLPQAKRQNSLIPFDAAQEAGLPTHQHQEAVMSYHFYRLLQRADEVHLLYTSTNDAPGGGERSRFVRQLEYELTAYNPKIRIINKTVSFEAGRQQELAETVQKDAGLIAAIREYLGNKGLYPTHLNEYIRCSMQFYLKHIVGVKEKEEVEEELGMDKIGTWLHAVLEKLDQDFFLHDKDPSEAEIELVLRQEFEERFRGYVTEQGLNRIYFQIGSQQIMTFLKHQMQQEPRKKILAAEQPLRTSASFILQGMETPVRFGGKIDRIELTADGTLQVMDYKTGSVEVAGRQKLADPMQRDEVLRRNRDRKVGYVRQLWMYEYLMYKKMLDEGGLTLRDENYGFGVPVKSGFYSFRDPKTPISNPLELTATPDPAAFIAHSEGILTDILNELLDPEIPFSQTDDAGTCTYCDFAGICGR